MAVWEWLVDSAGLIVLVPVLVVVLLVLRRRIISRHGGTFELSVRDLEQPEGRGWVLGLGRYREDSLEWYRIFSPLPVPKRSWRRCDLSLVSQRVPAPAEEYALYAGSVVVTCATPRGDTELAMSSDSLTGLQAWLEAGPPGSSPTL
jgi:hypothetical protein